MQQHDIHTFIDNSVLYCLLRSHKKVTVTVSFNLVFGLVAVFCNVSVQDFADKKNFFCLNLDICRLFEIRTPFLCERNPEVIFSKFFRLYLPAPVLLQAVGGS